MEVTKTSNEFHHFSHFPSAHAMKFENVLHFIARNLILSDDTLQENYTASHIGNIEQYTVPLFIYSYSSAILAVFCYALVMECEYITVSLLQ